MNISLSSYTPLETLLLFQSLKIHGVEGSVFGKISDLLKQNRHVRNAKQYDGARLSPDALHNLYQRLVNDEETHHVDGIQTPEVAMHNGDYQANTRKRKSPTSRLPSVGDAVQNPSLIPKLVEKLYYRYRSTVAEEIHIEECKWKLLKQEVEEIESGKWDHKLKIEATNGLPPVSKAEAGPSTAKPASARDSHATRVQDQSNSRVSQSPAAASSSSFVRTAQPHIGTQTGQSNGRVAGSLDRPSHPTLSISSAPNQAASGRSIPPNLAPSRPTPSTHNPGHQYLPPNTHQSPYVSSSAQPQGLPSNAQLQPGKAAPHNVQSPSQAAQHPHNLQRSPYSGDGQQPFSPSPSRYTYPMPLQQTPGPHGSGAQSPGPQLLGTQSPTNQPAPHYRPPLYPSQSASQQRQPQGPKGGVMLPPFQVTPQAPVQQQQRLDAVATPPPARSLPRTPSTVPNRLPTHTRANEEILRLLGSRPWPSSAVRPSPLTAVNTPSSQTKWKKGLPRVVPLRSPSVSPINDLGPPPSFPVPKPRGRPPKAKPKEPETPADDDSRSVRSTRRSGRLTRGASVTSSAVEGSVRGRTRSQSVLSHPDAMSVEDGQLGLQVKHEPSTPGMSEEIMPGIESMSGPSRRTRNAATAKSTKRKREAQEESEPAESEEPGTPGPRQIVAPRYFHKMSQPLLNDVTSHKYASLFSAPVKEKDAEGYKDIIKRPQDLKSIRTAINVGSKAVAAAAASVDTPSVSSPGGGGGNVMLPVSEEVMPPKAIVNSAQLERELMRMFANAVMFNTGEEGVVQDAREMFESAQQAVSNWRSAERTRDGEDAGVEEENTVSKRPRKL